MSFVPPDTPRAEQPPIRRVGLVAKSRLQQAANHVGEVAAWLAERGVEPVLEEDTAALVQPEPRWPTRTRDELPTEVDLLVVLGGDGTLLGMADRIAHAGARIPILGVNFGSLGFLTEVTLPELYPALESALDGTAPVDLRLMLRSTTLRGSDVVTDRLVLNDVVITKGALSRIIDLSVWVGDEFVTRFRADGLIIASPTGSTAYNLAAGGPIIQPGVDAVVMTPIAPHTLTNRPVVIPADAQVRVQPITGGHDEIYVTFDGQTGVPLQGEDVVTIARAREPLRLIRPTTRSYFAVLRQKLKWGER
jgi:NAD+ kinase